MTVALCCIVRDEAAVFGRLAASVRGLIDSWTVIDTGSTDGTPDIVRAALDGIPGRLLERPWVDFGTNRTELLAEARGTADWLLLLDADMTVDGHLDGIDQPGVDGWQVAYTGDLAYRQTLLAADRRTWRYEGVTHEYITADGPLCLEPLDSLVVTHHADGGHRADKFTRDRRLLETAAARDLFYLGQTCRDLGDLPAARTHYLARAAAGGWEEERWHAQWQAALLTDGDGELLAAWQARPTRAEPLVDLARRCRDRGDWDLALLYASRATRIPQPAGDLLFVHADVYQWGAALEVAIAAWRLGDRRRCAEICADLLAGDLPDHVRGVVESNLALCPTM